MAGHVCPWWLAYTFDHPLRKLVQPPEKILRPYVKAGMTVLDVGCGMGFFTKALARLVGPAGRVVAVDLQPKMLEVLARRAARAGLLERIDRRLGQPDSLGLDDLAGRIDMALVFNVLHELPNVVAFMTEIHGLLRSEARFFVVEPRGHVSKAGFEESVSAAEQANLKPVDRPKIRLSWAVVFVKEKG